MLTSYHLEALNPVERGNPSAEVKLWLANFIKCCTDLNGRKYQVVITRIC